MQKGTALLVVLLVWVAAVAVASPPENASDIIRHLEFMGYDTSMDSDGIEAKHTKYLNFFLKTYQGGILFRTFFTASDYGREHRSEWFELINKLNADSTASRYYIDEDGDLILEAYYPGVYEKQRFGVFVDAFNVELEHLKEVWDDLKKYVE